VGAEVHGRFFIARNVPLSSGTNSLEAATSATTLAGNSPSSDTVTDVALDTSLNVSYTYNANGDLIGKSEEGGSVLWTYSYTVEGWLEKVEGPSGFIEEYEYDPTGRKYMVQTTRDQETTTRYFVYDAGSVILELDEDEELSREFVRGLSLGGGIGGLLYVRDADESVGYFHYDGQGNVVSVTDESRTEVAYYEYDAWGNILTACGDLANEFRFSTKQASLGTGLIDFGYRHYDLTTARWTQRDPIGIGGGANIYSYLSSNPNGGIDPDGRGPINWILTGKWDASKRDLCAGSRGFWEGYFLGLYGELSVLFPTAPDIEPALPPSARKCVQQGRTGMKVAVVCATLYTGAELLAELPTMTIAIGRGTGSLPHVAFGAGGQWLHATGSFFGMRVVAGRAAEYYATRVAVCSFSVPVLNASAVVSREGAKAWSCVTAALRAFLSGWGL